MTSSLTKPWSLVLSDDQLIIPGEELGHQEGGEGDNQACGSLGQATARGGQPAGPNQTKPSHFQDSYSNPSLLFASLGVIFQT